MYLEEKAVKNFPQFREFLLKTETMLVNHSLLSLKSRYHYASAAVTYTHLHECSQDCMDLVHIL